MTCFLFDNDERDATVFRPSAKQLVVGHATNCLVSFSCCLCSYIITLQDWCKVRAVDW